MNWGMVMGTVECGVRNERGAGLHFMVVGFVAHQLPQEC